MQNDVRRIIEQLHRINSGVADSDAGGIPAFFASHTDIDFFSLYKAGSIDEMLSVLDGTPYARFLEQYGRDGDILAAEAALIRYSNEQITLSSGKNSTAAQLLGMKSDMRNLVSIFRCVGFGIDSQRIKSYLDMRCTNLSEKQWDMLLSAQSTQQFVSLDFGRKRHANLSFTTDVKSLYVKCDVIVVV